jgi:flagellar basal body-associated protein FliL
MTNLHSSLAHGITILAVRGYLVQPSGSFVIDVLIIMTLVALVLVAFVSWMSFRSKKALAETDRTEREASRATTQG